MYHPVSYELIVKAEIERRSEQPLYHSDPKSVLIGRTPHHKFLPAAFERLSYLVKSLWVKKSKIQQRNYHASFPG